MKFQRILPLELSAYLKQSLLPLFQVPAVVTVLFCAKQKYSEPFQYIISYRLGKHWLCSCAWRINFLQLQLVINKWNLRRKIMCYQKSVLSGHYCAGSWDFSTPIQHFQTRTYLCLWELSSALLCCSFKTITDSRWLGDRTPFDLTALPHLPAMPGCICASSSASEIETGSTVVHSVWEAWQPPHSSTRHSLCVCAFHSFHAPAYTCF